MGATRELEVGSRVDLLINVPIGAETWMKLVATVTRVEIGEEFGLGLKFETCRPQFLSEMNTESRRGLRQS